MMRKTSLLLWMLCLGLATQALAQAPNAPAPDFTGQTPSGQTLQLSDFQGKVVLLDFWASWCGPCRKEMPFLIELYEEHKDEGFEIIAVNIDTDIANMNGFLETLDTEVPFIMLTDPDGTIPPLYDLAAMPTSVFIDTNGILRFKHDGFRNKDKAKYRAELRMLLDEG